jgi:hypothetical protein
MGSGELDTSDKFLLRVIKRVSGFLGGQQDRIVNRPAWMAKGQYGLVLSQALPKDHVVIRWQKMRENSRISHRLAGLAQPPLSGSFRIRA